MRLSAESIAAFLDTLPDAGRYLVAYSGGLDSHVLLFLMSTLAKDSDRQFRAVHINHHLHPESGSWVRHCRKICRALGVKLETLDVDASSPNKESPESWARRKRYGAIEAILAEGEVLLTAHHQDDQVETFLLRLLRGAGVLGLVSMRPVRRFGQGFHARPLLNYSRAQLLTYAQLHGLRWIEDPSNSDIQLDRNYLRHQALPVIQHKWPSVALPISRTIDILAETQELLNDLARQDLLFCRAEDSGIAYVDRMQRLSSPRQKNVVRYWCRMLDLTLPDSRQLSHILSDIINSRRDSMARVSWNGAEIKRYGQYIYLGAPLKAFDRSAVRVWDLPAPCCLDDGELTATAGRGSGLKQQVCAGARVEIRYRRGGEKISLPGRSCRHKLKKLFQEARTPPWLRERIPLIFINDRLALVTGFWIDTDFAAVADEPSWIITWVR